MSAKAGTANLITGTRILCSVALLFCSAFSTSFYILYLVAGFTDIIDGEVARRTNTVSTFGVKAGQRGIYPVCRGMPVEAAAKPHRCVVVMDLDRSHCANQNDKHVFRLCDSKKVCCLTYGYE